MSARNAAAVYGALTLALTWPLAAGLTRDVPGDLGDSLLNMWILAWGADHIPRLATGATGWQAFWNANIFHPEPLSLAFSEHLFGQALQILPVYWLTGNIVLAYNLVFLSTFVLSALGAFLLVRDLTGDSRAAFVAGLVFGFLPYRVASIPHVQVLSAQWMPFALWGLNRFVVGDRGAGGGSLRALAAGTAALVMQNWSCGYYLLYFAPFVPLFVVHRMWTAGRLRDARLWGWLIAAAGATVVLTVPFLLPYADAQQRFGFARPFTEVVGFSASAWSYATASEQIRLWGGVLRFDTRPESETFLGVVPWILALAALGAAAMRGPGEAIGSPLTPAWRRVAAGLLVLVSAAQAMALAGAVMLGGFRLDVLGLSISGRSPTRLLLQLIVAAGLLLVVWPSARTAARRLLRSPVCFFATATVVAVWLSLGPVPNAGAGATGVGVYGALYDHVPGFNGVRVPARYAMLAGLFLSVLAGYGTAAILARARGAVAVVIALLVLADGAAVPIAVNGVWAQNEAMPPARIHPAAAAPPVYARLAGLPDDSVVTEFPFGDAAWEIRYVYYSHVHGRRITNGYSGAFPPAYQARVARWRRVDADPAAAWQALLASGTTHVVVHPAAFADPADAARVSKWLQAHGAAELQTFADGDRLYRVVR